MQPILRLTDYIEEYKRLVYDEYSKAHNIVLTTYYQLDYTNTQYDEHYMQTYNRTGTMSGRKYNQIGMFPVIFSSKVSPTMNSEERGVSFGYSNEITITIDPICGVKPHVGDILYFQISGDYSSWMVHNIESSGTLESPYWRCTIQTERIRPHTFPESIQASYIYVEYLKKILNITNGENFIKLLTRLSAINTYLNNNYNHNTCMHVHGSESYIEMDMIMYAHETLAHPFTIMLKESFGDVTTPDDSILKLLCLTPMYDLSIPYVSTFAVSDKNPRSCVYRNYTEYSTDASGDHDILVSFYGDQSEAIRTHINSFVTVLNYTPPEGEEDMEYTVDENIPMSKLLGEWVDYIKDGSLDWVSTTMIASNLLEAAIEYCLVSRKLVHINTQSVVLA